MFQVSTIHIYFELQTTKLLTLFLRELRFTFKYSMFLKFEFRSLV